MFDRLKHWFNENGKRTAALFVMIALLCNFTGCDSGEVNSNVIDSSASVTQSIYETGSEANSSSNGSSDIQNEQSDSRSEFDFDEAVKHITLFGHEISLPCMWSDFSEDFSYDSTFIPADNDLGCGLLYKGDEVGMIFFGNCDAEHAEEVESKPVVGIVVGFYDYGYPYDEEELDWLDRAGYYPGLLEFGIPEVTMGSTEADILKVLGTPTKRSEGFNSHYLSYDYDNGYLLFTINDETKRYGRLLEMYVCVEADQ